MTATMSVDATVQLPRFTQGAVGVWLDTSATGALPNLSDMTARIPQTVLTQLAAVTPVRKGVATDYATEHHNWFNETIKELRALTYIFSGLAMLAAVLLWLAPGEFVSARSLWIGGALVLSLAVGWLGINPPIDHRILRRRQFIMVPSMMMGLLLLAVGVFLPIAEWVKAFMIA